MGYFAVIDTETNWENQLMSVGIVVADQKSFAAIDSRYYILTPECRVGGMFDSVLELPGMAAIRCSRTRAMGELLTWLTDLGVDQIFAYNARFDHGMLPEFSDFSWYDIMALAAYRQYNPAIPPDTPCYATGRMKRGYGVEPVLQMLSGDRHYREVHNALCDASDELSIMRLLGWNLEKYRCARL